MKKEIISIRKDIKNIKNLIKPFSFWEIADNMFVRGDGSLQINTPASNGKAKMTIDVKPNTQYWFIGKSSSLTGGTAVFTEVDSFGVKASAIYRNVYDFYTFVTASNTVKLNIEIYEPSETGIRISDVILTTGGVQGEYFPYDDGKIVERMKDNGVVEEVRVRFYPGVENTLKVRPYLMHKVGRPEDLFTFPEGTDPYISGDDDYLIFPTYIGFAYDDEIHVDYDNTGDYPYTLSVDIVVTYLEGEVEGYDSRPKI